MNRLWGALAAVMLAACGGQAESWTSISESRDAVRNGTPATDPAVVALVARRTSCDGLPPEVRCSGSLISERWVLTAAHCVRSAPRGLLEVFFGRGPGEPGGIYRGIASSVVHPMYDRAFDNNDVALVQLSEAAPVAPMPLVDRPPDPSWSGRTARVVGFGGMTSDAGAVGAQRLQGAVTITEVGDHTLSYGPAPSMTCSGDSGGPVFLDVGGTEALVAVTTSGDAACEQRGVGARTDVQMAAFIGPVMAGAPSARATISPDGVCGVSCSDDNDCPGDLACRADLDGTNRCLIPDVPVGDLLASCHSDGDCTGGRCLPFGDECRCSQPCAGPAVVAESHGCQIALAPSPPSCGWVPAMLAGLASARRRRYRRHEEPSLRASRLEK